MKLQKIKFDFFYEIVLPEFRRTVLLEFTDIGVQPDRFAEIKNQTDFIQSVEDFMCSCIV